MKVRRECPRCPGVYGMLNAKGELIYVGKAKCLRARLLSYFRARSRVPKAGHILGQTSSIAWEASSDEFAALLRELELIRRWRPRFNVQGQPARRRCLYVCLGRQPAPYVFLSRDLPSRVTSSFGPVPANWRAREAVRWLNDWFKLRDCPQSQEMVFADQGELFPLTRAAGCLRYEIGTCVGPCLGACTRRAYMGKVQAARAFLAGTDISILKMLEREMFEASAALEFEQAARTRDKLEMLRWLHERLQRMRHACQEQSFVYLVKGHLARDHWYLIRGGRVIAGMPAPQTAEDEEMAAQAIKAAYRHKIASAAVPCPDEVDSVLLVSSWFRRHPQERSRLVPPEKALLLCQ